MKKAVDPITGMKRELAALTKKVATLEKQLADSKSATDLTCTLLTVVDSQGKTVASIDGNGFVKCRKASIAPDRKTRGVLLNGKEGSMSCRAFSLVGLTGNTKLVEIEGFTGSPWIKLCGEKDKDNVGVRLQAYKGKGGVIDVTAATVGGGGVSLMAREEFGYVVVQKPGVGRGEVRLEASYKDGGDGVVVTKDRNGNPTAWIPPRADGTPPEILTEKEIVKASGRKSTK